MSHEIDIYGVFVPAILVWSLLALVVSALAQRLLHRVGAYRWIWHRSLFDMALFVIALGAVWALAIRLP